MDFQELYVLKYKKGPVGPQTAFVTASNDKRAEAVGKAYCGSIPGCRYITVFKAVLATEVILGDTPMKGFSQGEAGDFSRPGHPEDAASVPRASA